MARPGDDPGRDRRPRLRLRDRRRGQRRRGRRIADLVPRGGRVRPPLAHRERHQLGGAHPGSFAAAFAYRRELSRDRAALRVLLPPAFAGGLVGSILLLKTPQSAFDTIVPFLVLFATALLLYQNLRRGPAPRARRGRALGAAREHRGRRRDAVLRGRVRGLLRRGDGDHDARHPRPAGGRRHPRDERREEPARRRNQRHRGGRCSSRRTRSTTGPPRSWRSAPSPGARSAPRPRAGCRPAVVRWLVVAIGLALSAILAWRRWGA